MATGGLTQTVENRIYLFRLQILIIDGGLLVLRNILDQSLTAKGITLSVCLNHEKATITRLKSRGVITQVQYDQLFPTVGQVPTTSTMDITLMICLLRYLKIFGLNKNFDWKATPLSTDVTVEADICRLKAFRNMETLLESLLSDGLLQVDKVVNHISKTTFIQPNDFVTWWNDIEQILVRRSSSALKIQQTINDFKICSLDPEEEKRVQEEIKKWKDYEADVDQLKEDMTYVKERVTKVEKNQEEIKRQLGEGKLEEDMTYVKERVTKVEKNQEEIKRQLGEGKLEEDMTYVKERVTKVEKTQEEIKRQLDEGLLFDAFCVYIRIKID
ncbi:uncharacterized protein LOC132758354 [Ruditapes philippinarum]|uniref:uncharacterized protein LOC132758354 n=1 Tax=Ruditapes philippinarum TaxID=129788 RepID=UPI00295B0326|nr:uncharacterized protein LOC132758354 [Ruditapes philippinarum]